MGTLSNQDIKRIRSLAEKKYRDRLGLFVVEGEKMVGEALRSGFRVEAVYRTEDIGEAAMARISGLTHPSPALAVVRKPQDIVLPDPDPEKGLWLALDSLRDPGNLGTVLRIADWFGLDGVFATPDSVDLFNPKVVQATMGAIFRVRFHYADLHRLADRVLARGGRFYGTFLDGRNLYGTDLDNGTEAPSVIVIGNEANGISPELAAKVSERLYIPPFPPGQPGSESLNAAVATAVTVAEFRRRTL